MQWQEESRESIKTDFLRLHFFGTYKGSNPRVVRLKKEGRIAFVLPKSLLTGVSWFSARSLLLDGFHLENIVVSYDARNGYNFSESTSLSETLITGRKTWYRSTFILLQKSEVHIRLSVQLCVLKGL